jgi:hypothetical protein
MKYNKGFAPLVVLLIVLGVLAVGGVAYFAGKSSTPKNEVADNSNYYPPVQQNQNSPTTNNNPPQQQTPPPANNSPQQQTPPPVVACTPSIAVLSPNGGETFYTNSTFVLKWKTCGVPANHYVNAQLVDMGNPNGGNALLCEGGSNTWGPECLNDGSQSITLNTQATSPGTYKIRIGTYGNPAVQDYSDNTFTILALANTSASVNLITNTNTSYSNQTISPNTLNVKVGSFLVKNTTSESINITKIGTNFYQGHSQQGPLFVPMSDLTNLKIKRNGVQVGSTISSVSQNNNTPVSFTLSAGATDTIDVFADIGSTTSGIVQFSLSPIGTGTSGTTYPTVYAGPLADGQVITIQ